MFWLLGAWSCSFDFTEAIKCRINNNNNEACFYLCIYSDCTRNTYHDFKESCISGFGLCLFKYLGTNKWWENRLCELQTILGLHCCLQPDAIWCCLDKPGQTIIMGLNTKYLRGAFSLSDSAPFAECNHFIAYITVVSNRLIYNTWSFT